MKKTLLLIPIFIMLLLLSPGDAQAQERAVSPAEDALCLPGVYPETPEDCLPLGPSAYLTEMAESGITLPLKPLPAEVPDPALIQVSYSYGKVNTGPAPVFNSLETAIEGKHPFRYIDVGFNYISYTNVQIDERGRKFYLINLDEWMRGADLTVNIATGTFQGVKLNATPQNKFGWILFPIETQVAPDFNAALTGKQYDRWEIVQVYDTKKVEDFTWYLIGPDEWVDQRYIGVVYPNTTPPEGVDNGRWIDINLFEQTIAVYEDYQMVFATLISTGVPGFWTRPGLFQIYEKLETTPMSGSFESDRSDFYYLEDVPWTMYFDEARALHGAYWHTKLGYVQSHGCVNLSPGDSAWFYNWGQIGDWVYVWDPSGETPTDPSLYGVGGA